MPRLVCEYPATRVKYAVSLSITVYMRCYISELVSFLIGDDYL